MQTIARKTCTKLKDLRFLKKRLLTKFNQRGARVCELDKIYVYTNSRPHPIVFRNWIHAAKMMHLVQ